MLKKNIPKGGKFFALIKRKFCPHLPFFHGGVIGKDS